MAEILRPKKKPHGKYILHNCEFTDDLDEFLLGNDDIAIVEDGWHKINGEFVRLVFNSVPPEERLNAVMSLMTAWSMYVDGLG